MSNESITRRQFLKIAAAAMVSVFDAAVTPTVKAAETRTPTPKSQEILTPEGKLYLDNNENPVKYISNKGKVTDFDAKKVEIIKRRAMETGQPEILAVIPAETKKQLSKINSNLPPLTQQ